MSLFLYSAITITQYSTEKSKKKNICVWISSRKLALVNDLHSHRSPCVHNPCWRTQIRSCTGGKSIINLMSNLVVFEEPIIDDNNEWVLEYQHHQRLEILCNSRSGSTLLPFRRSSISCLETQYSLVNRFQSHHSIGCPKSFQFTINKLASLKATLVRNSAHLLTDGGEV